MPAVITLHHHIGRASPFEQGLGVTSDTAAFEAQITRIARDHDVIDLSTLLSGRLPRRPALLTFDDSYRSVLEAARRVLAPRGLSAVAFVNPGILGDTALSLDQTLAWVVGKAGLVQVCTALDLPVPDNLGALVVGTMSRFGAADRGRIKDRLLDQFGPVDPDTLQPMLSEADVAEFQTLGVEVGNHTMTHVHGRALSSGEIEAEIIGARLKLELLTGRPVRAFSVPYGHRDDLTPAMLEAARRSGHQAIFLVHARSNARRPAPDIWYRTSLNDEAPDQLRWKLVVLPALRSLRARLTGDAV